MTENDLLISLRGVSIGWDGRMVLDDVNLDIRRGEFILITGPNGGGKTTLLRIILGLVKPNSGTVTYADSKRPATGYLPQKNMIDSRFPITVREAVADGLLGVAGLSRAERRAMTERTIARVGLTEKASSTIGTLSGGQLQRAMLGRAIVASPPLLVLDEPLSYVDRNFAGQFNEIIGRESVGRTVIIVTHEMSDLPRLATREIAVDRRIISDTPL
ncbi:MAG: metal ABC transporter ATP-binding protein [Clostridium sp.]|nr:metal ABC transporter ATP-binding protein [Clostridium sp.]